MRWTRGPGTRWHPELGSPEGARQEQREQPQAWHAGPASLKPSPPPRTSLSATEASPGMPALPPAGMRDAQYLARCAVAVPAVDNPSRITEIDQSAGHASVAVAKGVNVDEMPMDIGPQLCRIRGLRIGRCISKRSVNLFTGEAHSIMSPGGRITVGRRYYSGPSVMDRRTLQGNRPSCCPKPDTLHHPGSEGMDPADIGCLQDMPMVHQSAQMRSRPSMAAHPIQRQGVPNLRHSPAHQERNGVPAESPLPSMTMAQPCQRIHI